MSILYYPIVSKYKYTTMHFSILSNSDDDSDLFGAVFAGIF